MRLLRASYSSSVEDEDAMILVPEYLDSIEGARFIGLSKRASAEVLGLFRNAIDPAGKIIDYVKGHIRRGDDAFGDSDEEWESAKFCELVS